MIGEKKAIGVMEIKEGKSAISWSGYNELLNIFIKFEPGPRSTQSALSGIMNWCMCCLQCNLMSRCETLDLIHLSHISWAEDCMKIKIAKQKKDQAGEGSQLLF